ncbi:MAG: LD-carboxypeptidase [Bacteroidia bacterium]
MTTLPPYLQHGDTIGIACPARFIDADTIASTIQIIEQWGCKVKLCSNINAQHHQFGGTDAERTAGFNELLSDPNVKAILVGRGGYGCVRIVDGIDWNLLQQQPKWIVGYSDVTVFHNHIHQHLTMATLHAEMPVNFTKPEYGHNVTLLQQALFGNIQSYTFSHDASINGTCRGVLVGGNLSILYSLAGTPSALNTNNKILFIEDLDEYLYHIDRMLLQLSRGNVLSNIKGVVIGSMSDMKDNTIPFGQNAIEILTAVLAPLNIPVAFGAPCGHQATNYPLVLGAEYVLRVSDKEAVLSIGL